MSDTTDTNEDVSGLKNKNSDLIRQNKELKERAERAEREKEEAAEIAANSNSTELEKMQKRAERAEKALETSQGEVADFKKQIRNGRRDTAISELITANKVNPDDARAVKAMLLMELDQDSEEPTVGGQALADYAKSFFASEGKRYVQAADHNGGGASGSEGTKAPRMTKENWNWTEFAKIQSENPAEAQAIASAAGKNITQQR